MSAIMLEGVRGVSHYVGGGVGCQPCHCGAECAQYDWVLAWWEFYLEMGYTCTDTVQVIDKLCWID